MRLTISNNNAQLKYVKLFRFLSHRAEAEIQESKTNLTVDDNSTVDRHQSTNVLTRRRPCLDK